MGGTFPLSIPSSNNISSNTGISDPDPPQSSEDTTQSPNSDHQLEAMPASSSTSVNPNPKKRQRTREPREPDWHKFYKNGLPKEVIVIDDSPEPSASVISNGPANASAAEANGRHAAKKRKCDDAGSAYDPYQSLSTDQSPQYKNSTSASTISTDRTTSAIGTTAPTSLGSLSSNGQNGFDVADVQPGQKRKRTATRLQIANEAKRKELETNGDAFANYKAPPKPPIKAPDVQVKQVSDVSIPKILSLRNHLLIGV